jgi:hypothetical protein
VPGDDAGRVGAAYQLGRAAAGGDEAALAALVGALSDSVQGARRAAVWGLQAAGDSAVHSLLGVLQSSADHETLMRAADALGEAAVTPTAAVISTLESTLLKLHDMLLSSSVYAGWQSGAEKREQWMLHADTAATGCVLAFSFIGLRAVAASDVAICEQILEVLLPYLKVSGPRIEYPADNHYHGYNYHGVHSAAVLAASSLCGLPTMAANPTLSAAILAETVEDQRLSNATHTAAQAMRVIEQAKHSAGPVIPTVFVQ